MPLSYHTMSVTLRALRGRSLALAPSHLTGGAEALRPVSRRFASSFNGSANGPGKPRCLMKLPPSIYEAF